MNTTLYQAMQNTVAGTDTAIIKRVATEPVCNKIEEMGICSAALWDSIKNQKAKKHLARSLNFIVTGDLAMFDKVIAGAVLLTQLNDEGTRAEFAQVHFAMGGIGKDGVSHLPNIGTQAIRKALSKVGPGTIKTQTSRTLGINGLFSVIGATVRDAHGATVANKAHPFVTAFARRLKTIRESDLLAKLTGDPITGELV